MTNKRMPLAASMRPESLGEFVGQQHLLDKDSGLRQAFEQGNAHSMIFWGPPGTGKTTLARLLAKNSDAHFETLSAVSSGVKDIRQVVERAVEHREAGGSTIVFIDEVHRFNKSQQDALLPHVEEGLFTFIGATTENPSFEINNALLSRVRVYQLKKLSREDVAAVLRRAIDDKEKGLSEQLEFTADAIEQIAAAGRGDARAALGALELVADFSRSQGVNTVNDELLAEVLVQGTPDFDKQGDLFYELISALHKAVRGSSPDAALYWLLRMLEAGCDPLYIARRVTRMASEDIGNADPRALSIALDAWDVQTRLGSPEGELALAQAVIYMAVAPKSNAVYKAFNEAKRLVKQYPSEAVPMHMRNASTKLMKELDYGAGYRYAHDFDSGYASGESYLPEKLKDISLYHPVNRGLEEKIRAKLSRLSQFDKESEFKRYP